MRYDSRDDAVTIGSMARGALYWLGETIVDNPGSAGAVTAFCVAMTFFTANAVYFQDHRHPSALFATRPELIKFVPEEEAKRDAARQVSQQRLADRKAEAQLHPQLPQTAPVPSLRPAVAAADPIPQQPVPVPLPIAPNGEEQVAGIQELLSKLGFYDGAIDGLRGPKTNGAIDAYKNKVGLRGIELTEAELVTSMRNNLDVTAAIPQPRPAPAPAPAAAPAPQAAAAPAAAPAIRAETPQETVANLIATTAAAIQPVAMPIPSKLPSAEVVKVQAALKAFGNTDIVVDGVAGGQTELAIREFQALFHLPVTGEIDGILLDKMRAVGLIQ